MTEQKATELDNKLKETNEAIATSSTYKATQAERHLNRLGDGDYASVAQSEAAASAFSLVKEDVLNFVDNSKMLMSALDEVAKLHPFIQVAVSLFKAALTLELTRRENDDKVLALNATMCDMMSILTLLKRVATAKVVDPRSISIEDRVMQRMDAVIESIKTCAKVCDSYHKRNLTIKIFTSTKWKAKFTQVAQQFVDHKAGLSLDLQMHASIGIVETNETLSTMSQNVEKVMDMVFELMRSPEERELARFVSSKPGGTDAALKNHTFLAQILAKQRPSKEDSLIAPTQSEDILTVESLQKEIERDVDSVMRDNRFFEQKFEAMRMQLDEVRVTIRHETDRVIDAVLSGPHERIVDKDLYHIWKEMQWKGSVKAKHLVMAIRDHFAEETHAALALIRDITQDGDPKEAAQRMSQVAEVARRTTPYEDTWALQYITVSRVQPLIEAIDNDVSSFVTVTEVNEFTSARPVGWSLPRWVAYWMFGFEMTVQWYYRRIRTLLSSIQIASRSVLLANSQTLGTFFASPQLCFVENLLSGLSMGTGWSGADWDWDTVFAKFKDYVVDHENQLGTRLRRVEYMIDEPTTLTTLIVGSERPETYVLPLVFLLLRRTLYIVQQGSKVMLHSEELSIIRGSLQVIWAAIGDRVGTLRAMFKFQNLSHTEQLENFSFGLYAHVFDKVKMSFYWERDPEMDSPRVTRPEPGFRKGRQDSLIDLDVSYEHVPLCYGPQVEELDVLGERWKPEAIDEGDATPADAEGTSLIGHWGGTYTYGENTNNDGLVSFKMTRHDPDGTIAGNGKDAWGPFTVRGTISDNFVAWIKDYEMLQQGDKIVWYYEAMVQDDMCGMGGVWGLPESIMQIRYWSKTRTKPVVNEPLPPPGSQTDKLVTLGTFTLKRRPVEYFFACPPAEEFKLNRNRALWKLAINAAIQTVHARSRRLDWNALRERRQLRERFVELVTKRKAQRYWLNDEEERERGELQNKIHPDDLHAWNALAFFRQRREIVHQ
ncbi:hypothetical protein C2E23DRAFT_742357 [Lenzites betulinus]|nr:hypothetical protein C2E23DRAFT_742357 [Lenzites betulinus]